MKFERPGNPQSNQINLWPEMTFSKRNDGLIIKIDKEYFREKIKIAIKTWSDKENFPLIEEYEKDLLEEIMEVFED